MKRSREENNKQVTVVALSWPSKGIASEVCGKASAIMSENTESDRRIVTPATP